MIPEALAVTLLVTDALSALGVPYVIGGSLASSLHGVVRSTYDADVVADLGLEHVEALVSALQGSFWVDSTAVREAIRRNDAFNLIHRETTFKVDVFVPLKRSFELSRFARRTLQLVAVEPKRAAFFSTAEDTILAKLESYRMGNEVSEHQWRDILGILRVQHDRLDHGYLHYWAGQLQVSDLLERALAEARVKDSP